MSVERVRQHLQEAATLLDTVRQDEAFLSTVAEGGRLLTEALRGGHKIISCGNGGSHCDAMHFAEELSGRYRDNRPALGALAISDPSHITCVGNDFGFEHIFARQVEALGQAGDVLLGISTSGNSANIIRAVQAAWSRKMKVLLLLGRDGGKLRGLGDVEIIVPHFGFADRSQEVHIKVIHTLIDLVEQGLGYTD